jgi:exopolysaccharide biosynthesis polyprenyl glycosylphosphotransferase
VDQSLSSPVSIDENQTAAPAAVGVHLSRGDASATPTAFQERRLGLAIAVTDSASMLGALLAADYITGGSRGLRYVLVAIATAIPSLVLIFNAHGLYSIGRLTPPEEFRRVLSALGLGVTVLVALLFWLNSSLSREWVALSWVLALVWILLARFGWHRYLNSDRAQANLLRRTLVVGTNAEADEIATVLSAPGRGFEVAGHVRTASSDAGADGVSPVGDVGVLEHVMRQNDADCIYVASTAVSRDEMRRILKTARRTGIDLRVSSNLPELRPNRIWTHPFFGTTELSLKPLRLSGLKAALKRSCDLVGSGIGLLILSPVFIGIAVAVRLSSSGPVLYRQTRVGREGSPFTMFKFRTMFDGADEIVENLQTLNEASGPLFKIRSDPRVTPVGRWLRHWSLDELPQLFNVIRGEMSLVGPRPPLPEEVAAYEKDWHFDRLDVLPGVTGLWQVSGRSDLSFDDYIRLDLHYVENWSLALDLFILLKTVPAVLFQKGAF